MKGMLIGVAVMLAVGGSGNVRMANGVFHADTQSVTDFYGEEWGYDADFPDGTKVCIVFDDKGTENIYDDAIMEVRAW